MTTSVRQRALAETAKAVKVMDGAGLRAQGYVRPPLAPELLALGIQAPKPGRIRLWSGLADLEIHPSKRHRQVVLTASESDREITRTYKTQIFTNGVNVHRRIQTMFPVQIPRSRFTSCTFEEIESRLTPGVPGWREYQVTATKTAPDTTTSFLMGMDESHHFISTLPQVVSSVAEAHDVLRPPRVPKDALRQGEFFFVPAPAYMVRRLDDALARAVTVTPNVRQWRARPQLLRELELGSTHRGVTVSSSGHTYAIGPIVDTRVGHHSLLMLDGWHRVIRNTEERVREAEVRQRRRTWD